jgi:DNA-binding NarL/FixJ family response regulator
MLGIRSAGRPFGTPGSQDATFRSAPRLVLGLGMSGLASAIENHFQMQGWEVVRTTCAAEAGRYARRHRTNAIVLPVEAGDESGLLICAKLNMLNKRARIILVGPENDRLMNFAKMAGAVGYIPSNCGTAAIVRAVLGN